MIDQILKFETKLNRRTNAWPSYWENQKKMLLYHHHRCIFKSSQLKNATGSVSINPIHQKVSKYPEAPQDLTSSYTLNIQKSVAAYIFSIPTVVCCFMIVLDK